MISLHAIETRSIGEADTLECRDLPMPRIFKCGDFGVPYNLDAVCTICYIILRCYGNNTKIEGENG